MPASVQPLPQNQIGQPRSRSLTATR
jgi:hypothetical protein